MESLCDNCINYPCDPCDDSGVKMMLRCPAYIPMPKPITNAMKIRAMSDEELARILAEGCHGTIECPKCCGEYTGTIKSCTECWLDWLKEEVSE